MLTDDVPVFKLVGPVLMNVDLHSARENVGKRLEFIEGELVKIDTAVGKLKIPFIFLLANILLYYYYHRKL